MKGALALVLLLALPACKNTSTEDMKTICNGPEIAAKGMGGVAPTSVDPIGGLRLTMSALERTMSKATIVDRAPYLYDDKVLPTDKAKKLREQAKAAGVSPCAFADWMEKSFL